MGDGFLDKAYAEFTGENTGGGAGRTKKEEEALDDLTQEEVESPAEEALTPEEITDEIAALMAAKENTTPSKTPETLSTSVREDLSPETVAALETLKQGVAQSTADAAPQERIVAIQPEATVVPPYENMAFEELVKDSVSRPVLERECWRVLQTNDRAWNKKEYRQELSTDGYLVRVDGTVTELTPSMVIAPHPAGTQKGENLVRLAVYRAKDKLVRKFPQASPNTSITEQREERKEDTPESTVVISVDGEDQTAPHTKELPEPQESHEPKAPLEQAPEQASALPTDIPHSEEAPSPSVEASAAETSAPIPEPEELATQITSEGAPDSDNSPVVPETPTSPVSGQESVNQPEQISARREAREKYRALRTKMLAVRKGWEDAVNEYEHVRCGGLMGRIFDNKHLKEQADGAQHRYFELLESVRAEREKRMKSFLEERSDNPEHINRYAAFHEALLDRRIDQDLVLVERMNAGSKQPESSSKVWGGLCTARNWYAGLSIKDKIILGAGIGFAIGAVGAVGTGSAFAMLGAGTVIAARRAGGVLATGTIGGSVAGFVKGKTEAYAAKYVREKEKETKFVTGKGAAPVREQIFSQRKLSETLEQRLKIQKTGRRIRAAGTAGAVASVVGTAIVAGGSIAQGVHEALPEGVQQAMNTATAAEVAKAGVVAAQEEQLTPPVTDITPELASPLETEDVDISPAPSPVEDLTGLDTTNLEESIPEPQLNVEIEEDEHHLIQPPPPDVESVPSDSELKDLVDQLLRNEETLSSIEPPSLIEVPDDVPADSEDINAVPHEPTPVYTVEKGDNIWKILEKNLEARGSFEGLNEAQRIHLIDDIKDEITKLSSGELQDMGIGSGTTDLIQVGEHLDLSEVLDEEAVDKAIANAKGLTETQVASIDAQQTGAAVPHAHPLETATPPPFSSVSSQTPAPYTSVSALGDELSGESAEGGARFHDFSPQQTYEQLAKEFPDYRGEKTLPHFRSIWDTLKSNKELSTALLGRETHIRAAWGPLSHVPLRGVMDAQPGVEFTLGENQTVLNVQTEQELRTIITKCYALPEGREVLRAGIAREGYTVGDFMRDLNERLEAKTPEPLTDHTPEPVTQLASLDASPEAVAAETAQDTAPTHEQTTAHTAPQDIERPRRTTPLLHIEKSVGLENEHVVAGGRAGVRLGGGKPIQYVDVRMSDPVAPKAEVFAVEQLKLHPSWGDKTTAELMKTDESFRKLWTLHEFGLKHDATRAPLFRTELDPKDYAELMKMNGDDALRELYDERVDEMRQHMQRRPRIHLRVRPFKD